MNLIDRHPFKLSENIQRENQRVTYEWDAFMKKYPQCWDDLPGNGKSEAIQLAERQGVRLNRIIAPYREDN